MFQKKPKSTKDLVHGDPVPPEQVSEKKGGRKKERKTRPPKGEGRTVKEIVLSKPFLGALCLLAGLLTAFVAAPLAQARAATLAPVVVLTQNVPTGTQLTTEMMETVQVGAAGVPRNAITDMASAAGRFVATSGLAGDILTTLRLTDRYPSDDPELLNLPAGKVAMAVALDGLEQSVASKLRGGDVIQLFAVLNDTLDLSSTTTAMTVPELQAVEVLSVTNGEAVNVSDQNDTMLEGANEDRQIATVVLAVDQQQAAVLAGLAANAKLHAALVVRGDAERKAAALVAQANYFLVPEDPAPPSGSLTSDAAPEAGLPVEGTEEGGDGA